MIGHDTGGNVSDAAVPFGRRLRSIAASRPEEEALVCVYADEHERRLTWWHLEAASNRLARSFSALIDEPAGRAMVAIVLPNCLEFMIAACAAWKAGACVVTIDPSLTPTDRFDILELAEPALLIGEGPQPKGSARLNLSTVRQLISEGEARPLEERVANPAIAYTTGGSTGRPKLVLSRGSFAFVPEQLERFVACWGATPDDTLLLTEPLHHSDGFLDAAYALFLGMRVITMERFEAGHVVDIIERRSVNALTLVPSMMRRIIDLPHLYERDLSSLRTVCHSAAPCPPGLKRAWMDLIGPEHLYEFYTSTETAGFTVIRGDEWLRRPGSVGRPIDTELRILDDDGHPLEPWHLGRVFLRRLNGEIPFEYVGALQPQIYDGFTTVGDVGYLDPDGYLYLVGRDEELIITNGGPVHPQEVEAVLLSHPALEDAAVIGLPDRDWLKRLHAVVTVSNGRNVAVERVLDYCRDRLAPHQVPETLEFASYLPRSETDKLRRTELVAQRASTGIP